VPGTQAKVPGRDVDLVDVAEGLLDEEDPRAVVRPVGPLAEVRQAPDMRGQILIRGRFVAPLGRRRREGDRGHQDRGEQSQA